MEFISVLALIVQISATLTASYLFFSLYPEIQKIRLMQSTSAVSLLPFLSMYGNCVSWGLYGLLLQDYFPLVATNLIGIFCSIFYLSVYVYYTNGPDAKRVFIEIITAAIFFSFIIIYTFSNVDTKYNDLCQKIGILSVCIGSVMMGSPLVNLRYVFQTKSSERLPCRMILSGLLNTILWLLYGILLLNPIIIFPNAVNLGLSIIQISLLWIYPNKVKQDTCMELPITKSRLIK